MIHNMQVRYNIFNLSEQISTYISIFFKVRQALSHMKKMRTVSNITPPNPHKQSLKNMKQSFLCKIC